MKFTREGIIKFISKGRSYITWRTGINRETVMKHFFTEHCHPGVDIRECRPGNLRYRYDLTAGDYATGFKYVQDGKTYYMFLGVNTITLGVETFAESIESIAIGRVKDGRMYLIYEEPSKYRENKEKLIIALEKHICDEGYASIPRGYYHTICVQPFQKEEARNEIKPQDIECLKVAYEGVEAFKKLMKEFPVS